MRQTYIIVEDLLHAEELGKKLSDEGEGCADAEVGDACPNPGKDCEAGGSASAFGNDGV